MENTTNKNTCKKHAESGTSLNVKTVKNAVIEQGKSIQTEYAGLAFIICILDTLTCLAKLDELLPAPGGRPWNWIPFSSVAKLMIVMMCLRLPRFEAARKASAEELSLAVTGMHISPESLRQKMDILAKCPEAAHIIEEAALQLAAQASMQSVECGGRRLVPLDIDPTPLDNRGSRKEKTGPTYDGGWGYCPMTSFAGSVPLFPELRPGPQHSIKGTPEFLARCFAGTDSLCLQRDGILVRADCGLDGAGLAGSLLDAGVPFLIKRNARGARHLSGAALFARAKEMGVEPEFDAKRPGRSYYRFEIDDCPKGLEGRGVRCIAEVRVDLWNDKGQRYLSEELGAAGAAWWTSLGDADPRTLVMLYHDHATMEQHHGELKTDLGIERLPSGKFETNRLYLQLAYIAMAVLRLVGDMALQCDPDVSPRTSRPVQSRLRLRTILERYIFVSGRLAWHGRRFKIVLGSNYSHFKAFKEIHAQC